MLYALILICSLTATPDQAACDMNTAVHYEHAPEGALLPLQCLQLGEAWYAQEVLPSRPTAAGEYMRVICSRSTFRGQWG